MTLSHGLRAACLAILSLGLGAAAPIPKDPLTGNWTPVGAGCTVTDGMMRLTPRLLVGDEVACRFASPAPTGPRPWQGTCADLEGSGTSRVTLIRHGRGLALIFDEGPAVLYRRCARR